MSAWDSLTPDEKRDLEAKGKEWERIKNGPQTPCPECGAVPECFHTRDCSRVIVICALCCHDKKSEYHRIECLRGK